MFNKAVLGFLIVMASMPSLSFAKEYSCVSEDGLIKFASYISTEPPTHLADFRFIGSNPEEYLLICADQRPEGPLAMICYQGPTDGPSYYVWIYDSPDEQETRAVVLWKSSFPMHYDAPVAELKCSAQ